MNASQRNGHALSMGASQSGLTVGMAKFTSACDKRRQHGTRLAAPHHSTPSHNPGSEGAQPARQRRGGAQGHAERAAQTASAVHADSTGTGTIAGPAPAASPGCSPRQPQLPIRWRQAVTATGGCSRGGHACSSLLVSPLPPRSDARIAPCSRSRSRCSTIECRAAGAGAAQ